jgi:hypothetical protein
VRYQTNTARAWGSMSVDHNRALDASGAARVSDDAPARRHPGRHQGVARDRGIRIRLLAARRFNVRVESVKQLGVIQLRSWGVHELVATGAGSHPLGLAAIGARNFAITCMVPRPNKTNVNNPIKSRLSNFGIAYPLRSPRCRGSESYKCAEVGRLRQVRKKCIPE